MMVTSRPDSTEGTIPMEPNPLAPNLSAEAATYMQGYAAALEATGIKHHQPQARNLRAQYGWHDRLETKPKNVDLWAEPVTR